MDKNTPEQALAELRTLVCNEIRDVSTLMGIHMNTETFKLLGGCLGASKWFDMNSYSYHTKNFKTPPIISALNCHWYTAYVMLNEDTPKGKVHLHTYFYGIGEKKNGEVEKRKMDKYTPEQALMALRIAADNEIDNYNSTLTKNRTLLMGIHMSLATFKILCTAAFSADYLNRHDYKYYQESFKTPPILSGLHCTKWTAHIILDETVPKGKARFHPYDRGLLNG